MTYSSITDIKDLLKNNDILNNDDILILCYDHRKVFVYSTCACMYNYNIRFIIVFNYIAQEIILFYLLILKISKCSKIKIFAYVFGSSSFYIHIELSRIKCK